MTLSYPFRIILPGLFLLALALHPGMGQSGVFTPNPLQPINQEESFSSSQPLGVRLVAPRNGTATSPVVVQNVRGNLSARIGDLSHEQGRATFPASQLILRYGWEGLADSPPSSSSGQVVWVTAEVPPGTQPGNYRGELRITGAPPIPVLLEVGQWIAPRPNDYVAWQSYLHSPETIARHYNVTIWSEEHFALMEPSLRLLGQMGSHVMYLPVVGKTHFGNHYGLIRWDGSGTNAQPEFKALEKYFELWNKHVGPPRIIIAYMHEASWWRSLDSDARLTVTQAPSSGLGGGRLVEWPQIWQPGQAAIWKRAFTGLQQRIDQQQWKNTQVMVGVVGDHRQFPDAVQQFYREAAPGIRWATFTHGRGDPSLPSRKEDPYMLGGVDFGYVEYPYAYWSGAGHHLPENPLDQTPPWKKSFPFITSLRGTTNFNVRNSHPAFWHFMATASIFDFNRNYNGFGRMGLDFWEISNGDTRPLIGRYERWGNLYRSNVRWMTYPGPRGALSSQSVELARAGNAATEALRMMHDAINSGKLSSSLRNEATEAFLGYYQLSSELLNRRGSTIDESMTPAPQTDWQNQLRRLYDVAGQVADAAGMVAKLDVDPAAIALYRSDQARTWTSADGRSLEAMFVQYANQTVTLMLPSNQSVDLPLERLSSADQQWIRTETGLRNWQNRQGVTIEARLIDHQDEQITIEMTDGRTFTIAISTLSEADQQYLKTR